MDYAYHSEIVEQDKREQELDKEAAATISNLKFCNFRTAGFNKKKFPVDFYLLKKMCGIGNILEDAHIFKYLFGFETRKGFAEDKEGFDFYEYDIRFDQWNTLLTFLKFGECKLINGEPEQLMEVCNKFGGIPAYDRWYQNIAQRKKKVEDENYNPMTPKEDTKQLYEWRACPDNRMEWFGNNNKGYSIAGHHKLGQITYTYYWRKLKTDVGDVKETAARGIPAPAGRTPAAGGIPVVQNTNSPLLRRGVFTANQEDQQQYNDMHDFREDTILENFE
tara:strand:+ start:646 stop:1476 length:831 start_codon:yes stop_codon:yes gene_type:complete